MVLGPTAFAFIVWGSIGLVAVVMMYQLWAFLGDLRAMRAEEAAP